MSDCFLKLIPTDPQYVPQTSDQERAQEAFRSFLPAAEEISFSVREQVSFVDPGANFESVACPACGSELTKWWPEAMSAAYASGFSNLAAELPCCGCHSSLNDLVYVWPAGFARFILEASNPNVAEFPNAQKEALEQVVGCRLKLIWAHV